MLRLSEARAAPHADAAEISRGFERRRMTSAFWYFSLHAKLMACVGKYRAQFVRLPRQSARHPWSATMPLAVPTIEPVPAPVCSTTFTRSSGAQRVLARQPDVLRRRAFSTTLRSRGYSAETRRGERRGDELDSP